MIDKRAIKNEVLYAKLAKEAHKISKNVDVKNLM